VNFEINPSSKLYINLVFHLVNLIFFLLSLFYILNFYVPNSINNSNIIMKYAWNVR